MKPKLLELLFTELEAQAENDGAHFVDDRDHACVSYDGKIDLGQLADAILEAIR